ncbi:2-amino-3,7-dideoxy-D-threo-hept-6-ulosonate synthase [Desulfovibrio mangrovi]|uniref:class I fructose-bisphosphate aldolase n=1 Tax=Desulfovibrio mangrovi TaxID=2976983 RepID=UPI00224703FC|nr:2-amino-3,7-dideoxy-D-threo-hept-6-ulosonate synthase [Desulfovibrio mangrovi]UZP66944.1 2-amino-3,7-dideoxy-D-threo-hept-6-ulosonate synthase [Desulfovibrio mangrovi]
MIGILRKLKRFFPAPSGRAVMLSLDHGANEGMLTGLTRMPQLLEYVTTRNVQGVVLNKGYARAHGLTLPSNLPIVMQLSAGTRHGLPAWNKALVCSIPEALRLGADAVSVQINIGNELEDRMLSDFGSVTEEAHQHGLPVLAVIYAKGDRIVKELDPSLISHCVRLGGELGADIVSVPYSGDQPSFARAVQSCPAPVLVAGGPGQSNFDGLLHMIQESLDCGAAGVSIGRNVFQQENPEEALDRIIAMVHAMPSEEPEETDCTAADESAPAQGPSHPA